MMNAGSDTLVDFSAEVLERYGALVERSDNSLLSVLPEELARTLMLEEECRIGGNEAPLLYGSPLLDRIISMMTEDVPVVYGKIDVLYLKKDGFDQVLSQDAPVVGAQVKFSARAETLGTYMVLVCHYLALSDERKEGLIQIAVNEATGAVIPDFDELWRRFGFSVFPRRSIPSQFGTCTDKNMSKAMERARSATEAELTQFFSGMQRRLDRDVRNTREYYEALAQEMEESLLHPNLTETQRMEREAKIAGLPDEMMAKVEDLSQKYSVKVNVAARAALRLLVPVVMVTAQVSYKKLRRPVSFVWNPVTRRLDPTICEACGNVASRIHPVEKKSTLHMICSRCCNSR